MQYGQKRNTCKVGTMSGVIVKEIRLLGRSHIQGKWERCLEGTSGISGATHCRLKGVNILNDFKVFPFTTECLLLATKRNVFLHSAIQRMQVSYCCGPVGPGCCPRWWQTLALPMWCCFFMCTESKGYKVMEISSRVQRKGSSARQWAGGHIPGQHWRSWCISWWSWRSRCEGDLGRDDARNADWGKPQEWAESVQGKDCVGSKCQGHRVRDALPVGAQITLLHNTARCLVFSLSLIPSLISLPLFFPLGMRMLFLHNYILETCNLFLFYRCSQLRISSKTRRPWTWTFKQFQNYRSLQFEMCISRCRVGVRVMNGIKEMCLGIKLIRSGLVMVVLDSLAGLRNS